MATTTASNGDEGGARPVDEQRAALLRAMSTPALTASLEKMEIQVRSITNQVNGSLGRALVTQLEPVLRSVQLQRSIGENLRPALEQYASTLKLMEPMFAQISAQQQEWAESIAVPLIASAQLQARIAGNLITPELIAALGQISKIARVGLEFPDADGINRMSELIDSGDIDVTTLEAAEAGVGAGADMAMAIDDAAEVLALERPWMSRKRARQIIIVWVWLMWTAGLVAIAIAAPPIVGAITSAAGLAGSPEAAKRAGAEFDKRFPPEG